jgi:putative transposase
LGLSGRVPPRVDAATKAGLLGLVEQAVEAGWEFRGACRVLELGTVRAYRWLGRRTADELEDGRPGGSPLHGLLDWEVAEIVALFHEWGEVDRSHRKLAHRGSYLERVWVSPSSVRRVLEREGLRLRPLPRPGRSVRKPFPDWVEYRPKSIWIYDTTHFTRAGIAVTAIEDLVSRKWLAELISAEETATQVQVVFTQALEREGLLDRSLPVWTAWSTPPWTTRPGRSCWRSATTHRQMTSGSTREFMALCAILQHFGRPGTQTDQAWTWSLFGHVKAEWPHLAKIGDPAVLRAELAVVGEHYNSVRLHAGIGYLTPTTSTRAVVRRSARPAKPDSSRPGCGASPTVAPTALPTRPSSPSTTCPRSPAMLANRSGIRIANSETGQAWCGCAGQWVEPGVTRPVS